MRYHAAVLQIRKSLPEIRAPAPGQGERRALGINLSLDNLIRFCTIPSKLLVDCDFPLFFGGGVMVRLVRIPTSEWIEPARMPHESTPVVIDWKHIDDKIAELCAVRTPDGRFKDMATREEVARLSQERQKLGATLFAELLATLVGDPATTPKGLEIEKATLEFQHGSNYTNRVEARIEFANGERIELHHGGGTFVPHQWQLMSNTGWAGKGTREFFTSNVQLREIAEKHRERLLAISAEKASRGERSR